MEKVDVLLATYNGEKYLKEQLDSILSQTYSNFRLIISDDCSTDKTKKILEEYKRKDKRIHIYLHKKNLGVIKNFEFLLKKVRNPYYMFSDQDDVWKEDKIQKSLTKIKDSESDLVYSDLEVVDENLNLINKSYWKLKGIYHKIKKYNNFEALYLNNFVTGCTILSKKKFIKDILPLPKTSQYVMHDYWISLMVSQKGKISYIEEPLIEYRQHTNNEIGSKKRSDDIKSFDEMRDLFITVKKEHFTVFMDNEKKFDDPKLQLLNFKAYKYFEMLENVKSINFKNWGMFFRLYKYENFSYKMQNFLILNMPGVTRQLFKLRNGRK